MPSSIEITPEMMREIIMDHYSSPRNKMKIDDPSFKSTHSSSVNCIDDIDVYIKVENDVVVKAAWDGTACAISTASTDILCDLVVGKKEAEALKIIEEYHHMIHEEPYDASVLDEALAFMNTHNQPARIHCATIGWDAMDLLLKDKK